MALIRAQASVVVVCRVLAAKILGHCLNYYLIIRQSGSLLEHHLLAERWLSDVLKTHRHKPLVDSVSLGDR